MIYIDDFCFDNNSLFSQIEKEKKNMKKLNITFNTEKFDSIAEAFTMEAAYDIDYFIEYHNENRPQNINELVDLMHEMLEIKFCLKILKDPKFYDIEDLDWNWEFIGYDEHGNDVFVKMLYDFASDAIESATILINKIDSVMNEIVTDYFLKVIENELNSAFKEG